MAFTPATAVRLLAAPLDNKYKNEILFSSRSAQYNYFVGLTKRICTGYTYLRKDSILRVDIPIDDLWSVNYVMYENSNFSNRWFYAFVLRMEYINERTTALYLETDVFQTWMFDYEIKPSFVVREHVADDTIGKNIVDEGLEMGEYINEDCEPLDSFAGANPYDRTDTYVIVAVSDFTPDMITARPGLTKANLYGNMPSGLAYFAYQNNENGLSLINTLVGQYVSAGMPDAIVMMFVVPKFIINASVNQESFVEGDQLASAAAPGWQYIELNKSISALDGYTPKNNKMFCYPYKFLYVSNSTGLSATYRYENFAAANGKATFQMYGALAPDPKVILAPTYYMGADVGMEYALTLSGFPMCSWNSDVFAAWLAQNAGTTALALIGSAGAFVGGAASGNFLATAGGAMAIANELTQLYKASIQPDQAKGHVGAGGSMFGIGMLDYWVSHTTIKAQAAKRIDDFFTMYGYKVNALKVPEMHSREYWNYVQTIDINLEGNIPNDDMVRLKRIFDEGVTVWHTTTSFLDYSKNNYIS